jgi:rubrerythrin
MSIYTKIIKGDDGKKYWHCKNCHIEVEQKHRCPKCGKSIRQKK